jgi:arginase family enzyme
LCGDEELLRRDVVADVKEVGLATDLAVFDVGLCAACGFIHSGGVPLATASALEAAIHDGIISGSS